MALDVVALMNRLGHDRFAVVGHDRGAAVAYRVALDHPESASQLVVMDCVPIAEHLARCDARFASAWWHWFFLGQTDKPAEEWISRDPDAWYTATAEHMEPEAFEDYRRAIHNPQTVHAMVEDYRAGLGIDRANDEADRAAGRKIECPTLLIWALQDDLDDLYGDPLAVWAPWATDIRGAQIDCGHHQAEEAPEELAARLLDFLR
jgi:haloacetate dehalogenase